MNIRESYALFGLKPGASVAEAKHAYLKMVKTCHPDLFEDPVQKQKAEDIMKTVNLAYEQIVSHMAAGAKRPSGMWGSAGFKNSSDAYKSHYSESSFLEKTLKFAFMAGREVIEKAFQLYYVMQEPETPAWVKALCVGALGYFIAPLDAIPDITPLIGFADDLTVLLITSSAVSMYITKEIKEKARKKVESWFKRK